MRKIDMIMGFGIIGILGIIAVILLNLKPIHIEKQELYKVTCDGETYLIKYSKEKEMCVRYKFENNQVLLILNKEDYEKIKGELPNEKLN